MVNGEHVYMSPIVRDSAERLPSLKTVPHLIDDSYFALPNGHGFEPACFDDALYTMSIDELILNMEARTPQNKEVSCLLQEYYTISQFLKEFDATPYCLEKLVGQEISVYLRKNEVLGLGVPQNRYD